VRLDRAAENLAAFAGDADGDQLREPALVRLGHAGDHGDRGGFEEVVDQVSLPLETQGEHLGVTPADERGEIAIALMVAAAEIPVQVAAHRFFTCRLLPFGWPAPFVAASTARTRARSSVAVSGLSIFGDAGPLMP